MPLERPRTVAQARRRAGSPPPPVEAERRFDGVHLLAAIVGVLAGLVCYSAVATGPAEPPASPQAPARP